MCGQLDGNPLAIELAASRLNVLSPDELLARLDDRFQLLTAASRTLPPRHQALRATVDWSYQLLSDLEKRLFGRLSVFAGGFTLAAAEDVGSGDGVESAEVLDLLARLADKSLVVCEEADGRVRYRLLETLREYGSDRLRESGQYEAARSRHLDYFVRLAEGTNAHLGFFQADAVMAMWLNRIQSEEDNLRAALEWSELRVDAGERGQRLAGALHWFWFVRGRFTEGRGRLERLLERHGATPGVRARALVAAGYLAFWKGDFVGAAPLLAESVTLCRAMEEPGWAAFALCGLGAAASGRGEHALARSQLDAALVAARRIEDRWVTAFALHFLAQSATNTGDVALASSLLQECIGMLEQLGGNKGGTAFSLLHLGRLARQHGDLAMARNRVRDALRLFAELHDRRGIAYALVGLAGVSLAAGDGRAAAYLFGASDTLRAAGGPFLEVALRAEVDRDLAAAHAALGDDEFTAVWTAGRSVALDQTIAVALESAIDEALPVAGPLASQWTDVHGGGLARLSPRERQVAALVAEGRSNGEIGAALVIAARTADTHVGHILSKLGLHRRAQIAAWVVEHSLGNLRAK
jgi:non-specific serine/threonine protein kinase